MADARAGDRAADRRPPRRRSPDGRRARCGAAGLRVEVDDRTESVDRKIREAELQKVPYMLVVGDREAETGSVSVRRHRGGDEGTFTVEEFVARIEAEIAAERSAEPELSSQT